MISFSLSNNSLLDCPESLKFNQRLNISYLSTATCGSIVSGLNKIILSSTTLPLQSTITFSKHLLNFLWIYPVLAVFTAVSITPSLPEVVW